jgi:hypothetical protein
MAKAGEALRKVEWVDLLAVDPEVKAAQVPCPLFIARCPSRVTVLRLAGQHLCLRAQVGQRR